MRLVPFTIARYNMKPHFLHAPYLLHWLSDHDLASETRERHVLASAKFEMSEYTVTNDQSD